MAEVKSEISNLEAEQGNNDEDEERDRAEAEDEEFEEADDNETVADSKKRKRTKESLAHSTDLEPKRAKSMAPSSPIFTTY